MKQTLTLLCLAATLTPLAPVEAQDLRPPSDRFAPRSTVAGWDLVDEQADGPIRPFANVPLWIGDAAEPLQEKFPAHAPFPSAFLAGDIEHTQDAGGGYRGGATGSGAMVFAIPNWLETLPTQRLRIQVGYYGPEPLVSMVGYAGIPGDPTPIKAVSERKVPVQDESLPPQRRLFYEDWRMEPSATWNQITVFLPPETVVAYVVIDSITDPLPDIFEDQFEGDD